MAAAEPRPPLRDFLEDLAKRVADRYRIEPEDIRGRRQTRRMQIARKTFVFAAYMAGGIHQTEIAGFLRRDHSTISEQIRTMPRLLTHEPDLEAWLDDLPRFAARGRSEDLLLRAERLEAQVGHLEEAARLLRQSAAALRRAAGCDDSGLPPELRRAG